MFNINGWELAVIAILFILLFGPEKVPEVIVEVTRFLRQIRALADGATADLRREFEHAAADARAARETIGDAGADITRRIDEAARAPSIAQEQRARPDEADEAP